MRKNCCDALKKRTICTGLFRFPHYSEAASCIEMLSASTVARKTRLLCVFCIYGKGKCFLGKTPAQRIRYAIKVGSHYLFTPLRSLFRLAAKDFYLVGTIWRKAENRVRKKVKWSQWCRQAAQLQDLFRPKLRPSKSAIKEKRYQLHSLSFTAPRFQVNRCLKNASQ